MALSRSSSPLATALTVEESNVDRFVQWVSVIAVVSVIITVAVLTAIIDCADDRDLTFPWLLLADTLELVYLAVVAAARGHLMLFLPRAPFVVCEALHYAGFGQVGIALTVSNVAVTLLFHQLPCVMVAWLCLVGLLVAAATAFWICLVRTYGGGGGGNASLETTTKKTPQGPRKKSALVIEGLACLYSRLLYDCATSSRYRLPCAPDGQQDASNLV
jgi:hypothetical protein